MIGDRECGGRKIPKGIMSVLSPHVVCFYVCLEERLEVEVRDINANGASLNRIGGFLNHFEKERGSGREVSCQSWVVLGLAVYTCPRQRLGRHLVHRPWLQVHMETLVPTGKKGTSPWPARIIGLDGSINDRTGACSR